MKTAQTDATRLANLYRSMPAMAAVVRALAANGSVDFDQLGGVSESVCAKNAQYAIDDGICAEVSREHRAVRGFMSGETLVIRVAATDLASEVAAILK